MTVNEYYSVFRERARAGCTHAASKRVQWFQHKDAKTQREELDVAVVLLAVAPSRRRAVAPLRLCFFASLLLCVFALKPSERCL